MSLYLPDVTVVVIDCVAHALSRQAIKDTLKQITPREVLVWSDKDILRQGQRFDCDLRSLTAVAECLWYCVPYRVRTTHYLVIQYDGWVLDKSKWNPDWLNTDYIGAPWWYKTMNVGNGGFSLRSTAMGRYIAEHKATYPLRYPEDEILSRNYRLKLAKQKFYWASEYEAQHFAFERASPEPTFGFHGIFNWSKVLDPDALHDRLMMANAYVQSKVEWKQLRSQLLLARENQNGFSHQGSIGRDHHVHSH